MRDEFEDVYDDVTRRALDRWPRAVDRRSPDSASGWRAGVGATALLTAVALGVQEALEPKQRVPVIEEVDVDALAHADDMPVVYYHVPGVPKASHAIVRPWLM